VPIDAWIASFELPSDGHDRLRSSREAWNATLQASTGALEASTGALEVRSAWLLATSGTLQVLGRPPPSSRGTLERSTAAFGTSAAPRQQTVIINPNGGPVQYPSREADILRLANDIAAGLAAHTEVFPAPPIAPEELEQALSEHDANREAAIQARAQAAQSTATKDGSLAKIQDMSKVLIRYAENHTRGDDGKLQLLGWGARRARTVTLMEPPAQPRTLEVIREGKDWVFLDWKEPVDGGDVAAYRVQRRTRDGDWTDVGMAVESEVTLNGQESGVEYEYRVIAVNKAGEGPASNIARAVL